MIRKATVDDADAIVLLNEDVQSFHARHAPDQIKEPGDRTAMTGWFRDLLGRASTCAFVAVEGGATVGYVFAEQVTKPDGVITKARRHLLIQHIGVAAAHRHKGFGGSLLERCIDEARLQKMDSVELDVWAFNEQARSFFSKHGFEHVRHRMAASLTL